MDIKGPGSHKRATIHSSFVQSPQFFRWTTCNHTKLRVKYLFTRKAQIMYALNKPDTLEGWSVSIPLSTNFFLERFIEGPGNVTILNLNTFTMNGYWQGCISICMNSITWIGCRGISQQLMESEANLQISLIINLSFEIDSMNRNPTDKRCRDSLESTPMQKYIDVDAVLPKCHVPAEIITLVNALMSWHCNDDDATKYSIGLFVIKIYSELNIRFRIACGIDVAG